MVSTFNLSEDKCVVPCRVTAEDWLLGIPHLSECACCHHTVRRKLKHMKSLLNEHPKVTYLGFSIFQYAPSWQVWLEFVGYYHRSEVYLMDRYAYAYSNYIHAATLR